MKWGKRTGADMTDANKPIGYFIELRNLSAGRQIFSAATSDVTKEQFDKLWHSVGDSIYKMQSAVDVDRWQQFELRITPITHT